MTIADLSTCRCALFLPASNERAIAKASESAADLVILDLEDAVKAADKALAREQAIAALEKEWPMPVAIRLNGTASAEHEADVAALAGSRAALVVLPSVERADEVARLAERIARPVAAMIETPRAVLDAAAIAREAAALIAGTNDLSHALRLPADGGRAGMSHALQQVVLAARAEGIAALDGVCNRLDDGDAVFAEAAEGRALGFDGKTAIHPAQIEPIHRAFVPSAREIAEAEALVAAFGGGAERHEGRMIEAMHVEAARRLLARR